MTLTKMTMVLSYVYSVNIDSSKCYLMLLLLLMRLGNRNSLTVIVYPIVLSQRSLTNHQVGPLSSNALTTAMTTTSNYMKTNGAVGTAGHIMLEQLFY